MYDTEIPSDSWSVAELPTSAVCSLYEIDRSSFTAYEIPNAVESSESVDVGASYSEDW